MVDSSYSEIFKSETNSALSIQTSLILCTSNLDIFPKNLWCMSTTLNFISCELSGPFHFWHILEGLMNISLLGNCYLIWFFINFSLVKCSEIYNFFPKISGFQLLWSFALLHCYRALCYLSQSSTRPSTVLRRCLDAEPCLAQLTGHLWVQPGSPTVICSG